MPTNFYDLFNNSEDKKLGSQDPQAQASGQSQASAQPQAKAPDLGVQANPPTPKPQYGATDAAAPKAQQGSLPNYASTVLENKQVDSGGWSQNPGVKDYGGERASGTGITSQGPNLNAYLNLASQGGAQGTLDAIQKNDQNMFGPAKSVDNASGKYSAGEAGLDAGVLQKYAPQLNALNTYDITNNAQLNSVIKALGGAYDPNAINAANNQGLAAIVGKDAANDYKTNAARQLGLDILKSAKAGDTGGAAALLSSGIKGGTANDADAAANVGAAGAASDASGKFSTAAQNATDARMAKYNEAKNVQQQQIINNANAKADITDKVKNDMAAMFSQAQGSLGYGSAAGNARVKGLQDRFKNSLQDAINKGGLSKSEAANLIFKQIAQQNVPEWGKSEIANGVPDYEQAQGVNQFGQGGWLAQAKRAADTWVSQLQDAPNQYQGPLSIKDYLDSNGKSAQGLNTGANQTVLDANGNPVQFPTMG